MLEEGTKSTLQTLATRGDVITPEGLTVDSISYFTPKSQEGKAKKDPDAMGRQAPHGQAEPRRHVSIHARLATGDGDVRHPHRAGHRVSIHARLATGDALAINSSPVP